MRFFILVISLCIYCSNAICQWRDFQFDEIGQEEGYLARGVNEITQDSLGYIYFATEQGLLRYDGIEIERFQHDPKDSSSILDGKVNALITDQNGLLWLGRTSFIECFDPKTESFSHFPLPQYLYKGNNMPLSINSIIEEDAETLWLGGTYFSLHKFDKRSGSLKTYLPENLDPIVVSSRGKWGVKKLLADKFDDDIIWI